MAAPRWEISQRLEGELTSWLKKFEVSQGRIGYPIYPSVMWSLGGEATKQGKTTPLPASYTAGFYRREPLPKGDGLVFVPSKRFGLVVFLPRDDDLASARRLIDFDGNDIVVR